MQRNDPTVSDRIGKRRDSQQRDTASRHESDRADVEITHLTETALDRRAAHIRAVLVSRFAWLRFPRSLELAFRRSTHDERVRQNMLCALLGIVGFWWVSWSDQQLLPEISHTVVQVNLGVTAIMVGAIALCLMLRRPERVWPQEQMTSLGILAVAFSNIWGMVASQSLAGVTHTFSLVAIVAFLTIVVRQRFWYALTTCLIIVTAYLWFAGSLAANVGDTPQYLILVHHGLTLILCTVLALGANYWYEHNQRRSFLFAQLARLRIEKTGRTHDRLETLSRTDSLTGVGNRRRFDADIASAWQQASAMQQTLSLLLVDIDHFKHYNDTYGHPAGDACLQRIATLLAKTTASHGASVHRLGGEEFAVLLTDSSSTRAMALAEVLRISLYEAALAHRASPVADRITVSIGVAAYEPRRHRQDSTALLQKRADVALYRAKAAGRNQTAFGSESGPGGRNYKPRRHYSAARQNPQVIQPQPTGTKMQRALAQRNSRQLRFLRFAPYLEGLYQKQRNAQRGRELMLYTLVGLAIYNLYYLFNCRLIYDIPDLAIGWQVVMNVVLLALATLGALPLRARVRDALHLAGLCMLSVASIAVCAFSSAPTASSLATSSIMIALFAVVPGRLVFRSSVLVVLVTVGAYAALIAPAASAGIAVVNDYINLLGWTGLFVLIASYQLEYGARRGFVEKLNAQCRRADLETASRQLVTLTTSDPLTGISNRRRFDAEMARLGEEEKAVTGAVGLLVIDIDDFKQYNDIYGHGAGDTCLQRVASAINDVAMHSNGQAFRIGGEEFALLKTHTDLTFMNSCARQILAAVAEQHIPHTASRAAGIVSVSVGSACRTTQGASDTHPLLAAADRALYTAKLQGRNRSACDGKETTNAA